MPHQSVSLNNSNNPEHQVEAPPSVNRLPILWDKKKSERVDSPNDVTDKSITQAEVDTSTKMPLKKRMKFDQKLESTTTIHVSPMSTSSHKVGTLGGVSSEDSIDENKDHTTVSTADGEVEDFPAKLHNVLTNEEQSIMKWLEHGKAFRILRWDALRKEILPEFFPTIQDASIDAFLYQLQAWGYQEIKTGPDAGAFTHTLFRKSLPKLCEQMKFNDKSTAREVLQVPSLEVGAMPTEQPGVVVRVPMGWPVVNHNVVTRLPEWHSAAYSPLQMQYGRAGARQVTGIAIGSGIQSGRGAARASMARPRLQSGRGASRAFVGQTGQRTVSSVMRLAQNAIAISPVQAGRKTMPIGNIPISNRGRGHSLAHPRTANP